MHAQRAGGMEPIAPRSRRRSRRSPSHLCFPRKVTNSSRSGRQLRPNMWRCGAALIERSIQNASTHEKGERFQSVFDCQCDKIADGSEGLTSLRWIYSPTCHHLGAASPPHGRGRRGPGHERPSPSCGLREARRGRYLGHGRGESIRGRSRPNHSAWGCPYNSRGGRPVSGTCTQPPSLRLRMRPPSQPVPRPPSAGCPRLPRANSRAPRTPLALSACSPSLHHLHLRPPFWATWSRHRWLRHRSANGPTTSSSSSRARPQ